MSPGYRKLDTDVFTTDGVLLNTHDHLFFRNDQTYAHTLRTLQLCEINKRRTFVCCHFSDDLLIGNFFCLVSFRRYGSYPVSLSLVSVCLVDFGPVSLCLVSSCLVSLYGA